MRRKIFTTIIAAACFVSANAQTDSTKTFAVSGSVDAYYRFNAGKAGDFNNKTSFTNSQNSFELGMATLRADGSALSGKVTGTADLGFGRRAEEFSYNDGSGNPVGSGNNFNTLAAVKQLYVSYMPVKDLKFTIGKWATHIGYEVLDAYANRNYSMDYMFSYGPFSHTGLKAEYAKGTWGFMLGIANPTDHATTTSTTKTIIAQISDGNKSGSLKGYLNYQGNSTPLGMSDQLDFVGTGVVNAKFNVGVNGTYVWYSPKSGSSSSWYGGAVYLNYDPTAKVGLTLRGEYVGQDSTTTILPSKNVTDVTLSLNYKVGPLTLIPEIRLDNAKTAIFTDMNGGATQSTFSALLAAVYKF